MIKYILIICTTITFFACKKDTVIFQKNAKPVTISNSIVDTMLPLAIGNYWIYQKSADDTMGGLNLQPVFDSVYVEKDTLISGEHYYKLCHTNSYFYSYYNFFTSNLVQYVKDSSNYLVSIDHIMLLDKVHIHDTIQKNVYSIYEHTCIVPDVFVNKNFVIGNYSGNSMNIIYTRNAPTSMVVDTSCVQFFVKDIGIVKSIYSFSGCLKLCRYSQNLIRYHLN
jgi:hypothetical protein